MQKLWVVPLPAVAFKQEIGLARPPTARWILRHRGGPGRGPNVEDGVDERPGGFDAVATIEQSGVAAHAIIHKRGVGAAGGFSETLAIAEIHRNVADAHFRSRPLCAERNGDAFIGLNV